MMMRSSSFESPKSYLYSHNLRNSKAALLRCVISIRSIPILYHKLQKSPVFLQVTVYLCIFQAWFSVTNTLSDTYGLGKFPFSFMAQFFKAKKILEVNHATLHKIAEKIEKLEGNCVLINNTGRCGSTLLCQVNLHNYFNFHACLSIPLCV